MRGVKRIPYEKALSAPTTHRYDFIDAYTSDLPNVVDLQVIRGANIAMGVDPLGGAGVQYWTRIAERFRPDLTVVNEAIDPTFGFMSLDGYPWLIHRLTYRRTNHANLHVRGYKEEGTTTTPFDMAVLNDIDRFHLVKDVADRVPGLGSRAAKLTQLIRDELLEHKRYIERYGDDMPEIRDWRWGREGSAEVSFAGT